MRDAYQDDEVCDYTPGRFLKRLPPNAPVQKGGCIHCIFESRGTSRILKVSNAVRRVKTPTGYRDLCERHASRMETKP